MFGRRNPYEELINLLLQVIRALSEAQDWVGSAHIHNDQIDSHLYQAHNALNEAASLASSHTREWEDEDGEYCQ